MSTFKFEEGQKAKVIGTEKSADVVGEHRFKLGTEVTVDERCLDFGEVHYGCSDKNGKSWYVAEEDLEEIN